MRVAAFHNSREGFIPESSRPELSKKNRCSCSALAALQKIQKWDRKADEAYAKTHGGRKSPVREENKCWEAVINLNSRHDMKDVKKLVKKLEQITGYRAAQIAIHRDEGHTNDDGNFIRNIHAHVIFYARDLKTGLSLSAANYGRKDLMRLMQDAVAEELQMERGRPAEETGKKHLSPRAYKAQKRQEAEWEAKLEKNNAEWQEKLAQNNKEWEQKKGRVGTKAGRTRGAPSRMGKENPRNRCGTGKAVKIYLRQTGLGKCSRWQKTSIRDADAGNKLRRREQPKRKYHHRSPERRDSQHFLYVRNDRPASGFFNE
jgi:mobilization protein